MSDTGHSVREPLRVGALGLRGSIRWARAIGLYCLSSRIVRIGPPTEGEDGSLLAGELPPNKHKLVVAWIEIHQEDLLTDWGLAVDGKKPFPIRGLDQ